MTELPIIDVTGIKTASSARLAEVARDIGAASRGPGFFYIVNHGLSDADMADVFGWSRKFFALPLEEKAPLAITKTSCNRGYVHMKTEALDPGQNIDNKEAMNIGLQLEADDPELLAGAPSRALNMWPRLEGFRPAMLEFFNRIHRLGCDIHRAIAVDLGLDADYFEPLFDKPMATVRLLHYPAGPQSDQFGAGAHTDYGNLTLLAVDEIGGLQVRRRGGGWIDAPPVPGAFICNIGDCLMRWTNGVYASTPHRVVSPEGVDRYSIAFFLDPNPEAMVDVIDSCVTRDNPKRYAPISASAYLAQRFAETYGAYEKK